MKYLVSNYLIFFVLKLKFDLNFEFKMKFEKLTFGSVGFEPGGIVELMLSIDLYHM